MNHHVNGHPGLINRPPREINSKVAITRSQDYSDSDRSIKEALDLLGLTKICEKGDKVLIKPNLCLPTPPEDAETTHPEIVASMVRLAKEQGATVQVGDSCAWHLSMELVFETSQVREAALAAGADEVLDFAECDFVEVRVPDPRVMKTVAIPRPVAEADVIINLPKMKNNFVTLTTLAIKNMFGLLRLHDRHRYHRTPMDMAWACNDIFKAIKDQHRLTVIDGIWGVEGATHAGPVCKPGVVLASEDPIAVEAIANMVMGYHALESPHVQVGMKDDLGTGDPAEIDVLGASVEEVLHPFQRSLVSYVSRYTNVTEYYGGTCAACLWPTVALPPVVDPDKKYAVISGARVFLADDLEGVDEAYLVGTCACTPNHQHKGFMDKVRVAKKVIKLPTCPAMTHLLEERMGGVYDQARDAGYRDLIAVDGVALTHLPDTVRPELLPDVIERKEGRKKSWP